MVELAYIIIGIRLTVFIVMAFILLKTMNNIIDGLVSLQNSVNSIVEYINMKEAEEGEKHQELTPCIGFQVAPPLEEEEYEDRKQKSKLGFL